MYKSEHGHRSDELATLLNNKYSEFNQVAFIKDDPIQIPHLFSKKEDIEIAGFLTATISWGNRKAIIKSAHQWMKMLDYHPHDFIMNADEADYKALSHFYYRTFNGVDTVCFLKSLKRIYLNMGGLEQIFASEIDKGNGIKGGLQQLHRQFFTSHCPTRTLKHLANITKGASAKRLNMFLRWMVRNDSRGVDFGLWKTIPTSALYVPLDVHTGNVSRSLGLLQRKSNDWKAVEELTKNLQFFDKNDPVKYDFALFGMGIERFLNT